MGVEVHQPAGRKRGDLRVRDPHELAPRALAEPAPAGEDSCQLDDKAVPQRWGVPIPHTAPS